MCLTDCLHCSTAAVPCTRSCCGLHAGSLQQHDHGLLAADAMAGILAQAALLRGDSEHLEQCLRVAGLLLARLPSAKLALTAMGTTDKFTCLADVWHKLILPSLLDNKMDAVR